MQAEVELAVAGYYIHASNMVKVNEHVKRAIDLAGEATCLPFRRRSICCGGGHFQIPGNWRKHANDCSRREICPATDSARTLRIFAKRLLEELGWGLELAHDSLTGEPIEPRRAYRYRIDGGAEAVDGVAEGALVMAGESLLSLAREELADPQSLADARRLLRAALDQCLDGRALRTREVMIAMRARSGSVPGG